MRGYRMDKRIAAECNRSALIIPAAASPAIAPGGFRLTTEKSVD